MTGSERWLMLQAVRCAKSRRGWKENSYFLLSSLNVHVSMNSHRAGTRLLLKWLWSLMQASTTDNPLWYYSKASHRERFLYVLHVCVESCLICSYPPEYFLGFACQPCSANPDWGLVSFSSCGVGLWCIKAHWGLALSAALAVWFWCCGLVPGWPFSSWEAELYSSHPPLTHPLLQGLQVGTVWDRCLKFSATQRGSSHGGLEKLCAAFYHSAPRSPFFISGCCSWFPLSSPALKGVSVWLHQFLPSGPFSSVLPPLTQALRSLCSKMGWVQSSKISAERLIYSYQTAFSFLTSWLRGSTPCMGIFLIHCVILIDPICSLVP